MTDEDYMREALALAKKAFEMGEVPVGAVAVWDGKIVGRGMNRRETDKNALHHAEVEAIDEACRSLKGWRRCHRCQNRDCYPARYDAPKLQPSHE